MKAFLILLCIFAYFTVKIEGMVLLHPNNFLGFQTREIRRFNAKPEIRRFDAKPEIEEDFMEQPDVELELPEVELEPQIGTNFHTLPFDYDIQGVRFDAWT